MRRPQYSLKTLLWLMVVVAAFFGGMAVKGRLDKPVHHRVPLMFGDREAITLPDGTIWARYGPPPKDSSAEDEDAADDDQT